MLCNDHGVNYLPDQGCYLCKDATIARLEAEVERLTSDNAALQHEYENSEKMFQIKQDDWIEQCAENDAIRAALAAAEEQIDDLKENLAIQAGVFEGTLAAAEAREKWLREKVEKGLDVIVGIIETTDCHYSGTLIRREANALRLKLLTGGTT